MAETPPKREDRITADAFPQVRPPKDDGGWRSAATSDADALVPVAVSEQFSLQSQSAIRAIETALANDSCTQIDSYGPGYFSAQVDGHNQQLEGSFSSNEEYMAWIKQVVDAAGAVTKWSMIKDKRRGVLNTVDGSRLTVILPPIAEKAATFSLRKHSHLERSAVSFVESGVASETMIQFLRACVAARINILLVGQMGSGKTTLLRSLAAGFGDNEKIAVVEQVPELKINKPLAIEYVYQPMEEGLDLASVLDDQLYNGIDRLIVGEVHLAGITKMLEVMIVTEGSMSTYHAFTTEQAGERMKLALQIENQNVTAGTAMSFIKQAVELVVVLEVIEGRRRIKQITELDWRSSAGREVLGGSDLFEFDPALNDGAGGFKATGNPLDESGRILSKASKYGVGIDREWFIDQELAARLQRIARDERRR
jgi:pilus assembly protein CpaF